MGSSVKASRNLSTLSEVLAESYSVSLIEEDIYSVLPDLSVKHHYDRRAAAYDLVVRSRLYNSLMWGSSPLDYIAFARQAIDSCSNANFLDAGCGSLLFTAHTYTKCNRKVITSDQSLAMLRRARRRLIELAGQVPEHIVLLQADLKDLPFRPASFQTVLCLNVLHQFEDAAALIPNLKRLLTAEGQLFLTSLVLNNRFVGDRYLQLLYAAGEFVRPRSNLELRELMTKTLNRKLNFVTRGNMAFVNTAALS